MAASMQEQDIDVTLKVIVVGNGCVGKTSMITRYAKGVMTDNYKKTIGTDFCEKDCVLKGTNETIKLHLWDTAGQEMFAKLTKAYYKGAGAVVFAFSTTDRDSFLAIEDWKRKVEDEVGPICAVLVQNKTDLMAEAKMTSQEVEDLARRIGVKLYRMCVKDNLLVSDVFEYLADCYLKAGGAHKSGDDTMIGLRDGSADHKGGAAKDASAAPATAAAAAAPANDMPQSVHAGTDGASNGANGSASQQAAAANKPFQLEPSTQRTGGKKNCACG